MKKQLSIIDSMFKILLKMNNAIFIKFDWKKDKPDDYNCNVSNTFKDGITENVIFNSTGYFGVLIKHDHDLVISSYSFYKIRYPYGSYKFFLVKREK
jgi:hypothetical protein